MRFRAAITPATTGAGVAAMRRDYSAHTGEPFPLPGFSLSGSGDFRLEVGNLRVHDVMLIDLACYGGSFAARTTGAAEGGERVLVNLMQRGAFRFARPQGQTTVTPGDFVAHDNGVPTLCEGGPGAAARILVLPRPAVRPVLAGRPAAGPARSPEVRVLAAHARMLGESAGDLSPAGLRGARDALLELVRGTLLAEFDDTEPLLAPALARAAMTIADSRLADPDLSPSALARELSVSVRTLHRAFAAAGEPVAAYIRRRRLERARLDLAGSGRLTVAEVAARWQFADHAHFSRAFTRRYGETPSQFARSGAAVIPPPAAGAGRGGQQAGPDGGPAGRTARQLTGRSCCRTF